MRDQIKKYYGKTLNSNEDLQTNACCSTVGPDLKLRLVLEKVHPEVRARFYGCGFVVPPALTGCEILDLGCGAGRDVYLLSHQVGAQGRVVGVDMTAEQLQVAKEYQIYHSQQFEHPGPNTEFYLGYLEQLSELNLGHERFDLVVSNCVLNLCTDKSAVLQASYDLLKPGGELYFSDVYSDRRVPEALQQDQELYSECLSGALYEPDFIRLAQRCGFLDPRRVERRSISVDNAALQHKLGAIQFSSITYRLLKCTELEPDAEDYGQQVRYLGGADSPASFCFDAAHEFVYDQWYRVSGNTFSLLHCSRYAPWFEFKGDRGQHLGAFHKLDTSLVSAPISSCC